MTFDWALSAKPISPFAISAPVLRRQTEAHEAGHAVIGVAQGFDLERIVLGKGEPNEAGDIVAGYCVFEAPGGDQRELARQRPDDFAPVMLAGCFSERVLTGLYLDDGFAGDLEILQCGFGWEDGADPALLRQVLPGLITQAQDLVLSWQPVIAALAGRLDGVEVLEGSVVHDLVAQQRT